MFFAVSWVLAGKFGNTERLTFSSTRRWRRKTFLNVL